MRPLFWALAFAFVFTPALILAQDEKADAKPDAAAQEKKEKEPTSAELFRKYKKEANQLSSKMNRKMRPIIMKLQKASPDEQKELTKEIEKIQAGMEDEMAGINKKIFALAETTNNDDPKSSLAFDTVVWVMQRSPAGDESKSKAMELLVKHHLNNKKMQTMLRTVTRSIPSQQTEDLLNAIIEKSSNKEMQADALMKLSDYLSNNRDQIKSLLDNPQFKKQYGDSLEYFKKIAATEDSTIEDLLKQAKDQFGDVKMGRKTVEEIVDAKFKRMEVVKNLKVGKVAPDIEGPDLDGENFKLSDYRGKVVMLDFWGDW